MSGGGGYSLGGGGGGRVKEPTVTFKRPLRIHSETENLIELSKAWSSKGDTESTSVNPHLASQFNIGSHDSKERSHDTRERSHDIRTRSHDSKRSHETGWTSRDSSSRYLRPGASYHSINEREGGRGTTRPPLSSRTRDLLSSPYLGSIGSSHTRSPSPSKPNPSSLFGAAADFRNQKSRPHPHSLATSRPVDVPVVNGVPVTMTRKVVREGGEGGRVKEKRRFTYREEGAIPLSNSQVSSLLEKIERQKRDREALEKKLSSHSDLTSSSHAPLSHSHYVIETAKRRKIATAPPPKGYTGFTSASSQPLTFKPKTHPLSKATPTTTRPPVELPADKKTWAVPRESPVITPSSWRSGQELVKKMLEREVEKDEGEEKRSRPTYGSNAQEILRDMETTSEEEEEEEEEEEVKKTKPVNPVKQVLKLSESVPVTTPPSQPHRQYNRESVQKYMLSKQEERKRKLEEDRATRAAAEADRKRRLQELRERQQNILINNLQAQQKRKETVADEGTSSIHIHFENRDIRHVSNSSSHPPSLFTPSRTPQSTPLSSSHPHISHVTHSRLNTTTTPPIFTSIAPPTFATPITTSIAPSSADSSFIFSTPVAVMTTPNLVPPTRTPGVSASPRTSLSFSSPYMVTRGTPLPTSSHSVSHFPLPPPPPSDREAKLLELQNSALSLKQRIENERKKLEIMTSSPKPVKTATPILPPTRIIKSQSYETSTQTLRTLSTAPPSPATPILVPSPRPLLTARPSVAVTTAPAPVRLPWQQKGGDRFSVINIYTQRQGEKEKVNVTDGGSAQEGENNGGQVEEESEEERKEETESETEEEEEEEEEEVKQKEKDIKDEDVRDEDISWTAVSPVPSSPSPPPPPPPPLGGGVSVITPPGSPSFTESFVTPPTTRILPIHVMETKQSPRYSPHSLGLQLKAELNILEAVEEGVRHVEGVESARAVAEAQQETVALAQLLQTQTQTQEMKMKEINNKNKERLRETEMKLDKEREERVSVSDQLLKLKEKTQEQTATNELRSRQLEEERVRSHSLVQQQQLINTQSELTSAVLQSTQALVESVAKAAAESAVRTAMEERREKEREEEEEDGSSSYDTDFEPQSFETDSLNTPLMTSPMSLPPTSITTTTTTSHTPLIPPVSHVPSRPRPLTTVIDLPPVSSSDSVSTLLSPRLSGGSKSSRTSGTLTPDETQNLNNNGVVLTSHEEEIEEEIEGGTSVTDEEESESGGGGEKGGASDDIDDVSFRELLPSEAHRRQQRKRLNSNSSDISDVPITMLSGEGSPLSVGEESFNSFVNRMVSQYVKEEEMRAKHQSALLKLRERAVKEKSQAQLKWLNVKKKSLINKKDDESMPLLQRKEDGVRKKLKQEQAEIKRLQEAHKRASQDRKLLLLQQQDIARLQRSTKQYVEKIRRYGGGGTGTSPLHLEYSLSPSPSPLHSPDVIHSEEVSESASLTDSPVKSASVLEELELSSQSSADTSTRGGGAMGGARVLGIPSSQTSDNYKLLKLKESSEEKEKELLKYEEKLIKKRQTAEELLSYKQELERREKQLKEEEGNINRIIERAIMSQQDKQGSNVGSRSSTVRERRGRESSSISEDISAYNTDTFETDTAAASTHLTSTPQQQQLGSVGDLSLGSPNDEEDKRLMELQAVLMEKEKELKKRKKEALRAKREQQEKAIKARLIEIEKELQEQSEEEPVNTVPSIQITSHETLVKPVQKQVLPVSELVVPVPEQVLPVRKEEATKPQDTKSPLSSSSSSSVSTVISNEGEIEEEITSSLISNTTPSKQTKSQTIATTTSAPPTVSSAPPTISAAPPTVSSAPPTISAAPPTVSVAPTISSAPPITSSTPPTISIAPPTIPPAVSTTLVLTSSSASILAATPTTAPVTPPISIPTVIASEEPIPNLLTSTAVVSTVSVTPTIPSHKELISSTATVGNRDTVDDALTVTASPRPSPSPLSLTPDISEDTGSNLSLSQRVLVANSVQGVIEYIGTTDFASGIWIGVNLDEPRGKNDGSVNGKRYFSCPQKHGVFAPPSKVFPIEEESSGRETSSSISEEFSSEKDERESLSAISPEPLLDNVDISLEKDQTGSGGAAVTGGSPLDDDNDSYTAISENEETQLDDTLVQEEEEEGEDDQAIKDGEFESVADIWRKKKGPDTKASIDKVTDQLLSALVQSEVDLICNIRDTREALNQGEDEEEEERGEAVKSKEEDKAEDFIEVKINKSVNKERGISFSSALVPNSRQQVNRIVQSAWNTLKNHISSQLAKPSRDQTPPQLVPSQELINELCNKTGVMLNCEKSFVHLVFNLALRVMEGERTGSLISHKISCSTLEHVQDRVHALLEQRKRPHPLPPLRYLHNNRRTGGKEVDFIDSVLLSEMRQEEPSWINYRLEEDKIKKRTADEILEFLIDETVEVIKDIYAKKERQTN